MLTGDMAMTAMPTDWRDEVQERGLSEELTKLLAASIASKAEKRPANAADLADRLGKLLRPKDVPPPPPPPPPRKKATQAGDVITNSLGMKLAWIPPGSFL